MTTFPLDTNTVSYLADHASPFHQPASRLSGLPDGEIAISILTLYELTYGFFYAPARSRLLSIVREQAAPVVPLTEAGTETFATLAGLEPRLAVENWTE